MNRRLVYVELKSGYSDNGPAWIGPASFSKSGKSVYFNDRAFQSCGGRGVGGNYFDVETGEEYWISGVKKNMQDRHWAGSGKIMVDASVVDEYLSLIEQSALDPRIHVVVELDHSDAVKQRVHALKNQRLEEKMQ